MVEHTAHSRRLATKEIQTKGIERPKRRWIDHTGAVTS
jgi:hypothetical protein